MFREDELQDADAVTFSGQARATEAVREVAGSAGRDLRLSSVQRRWTSAVAASEPQRLRSSGVASQSAKRWFT